MDARVPVSLGSLLLCPPSVSSLPKSSLGAASDSSGVSPPTAPIDVIPIGRLATLPTSSEESDRKPDFEIVGIIESTESTESTLTVKEKKEKKKKPIICSIYGCSGIAYYGSPEERKPLYCLSHKISGYVDVVRKYCFRDGCKNVCESDSNYCFTHGRQGPKKHEEKRRCYIPTCKSGVLTHCIISRSSFSCTEHIRRPDGTTREDAVPLEKARVPCEVSGCRIPATYIRSGKLYPSRCNIHHDAGMIPNRGHDVNIQFCDWIRDGGFDAHTRRVIEEKKKFWLSP